MALTILFLAVGSLLCYLAIGHIAQLKVRKTFARQYGTKPLQSCYPPSPLGFALWRDAKKSVAELKGLEHNAVRFEKYGTTYGAYMLGNSLIATMDPENVKAVLSTKFADFGLGQRLTAFGPLIGKGIFTSDGSHWEHSRVGL
jgi:hypothetical protein